MRVKLKKDTLRSEFVRKIKEISGQDLMACYQCGKCSAGCPMIDNMDLLPNQIIRLAQLGLEEEIARSDAIWQCASCTTCGVRCPRGVDLSQVMEALRQLTLRKNTNAVKLCELEKELLGELPPIAMICALRKLTG